MQGLKTFFNNFSSWFRLVSLCRGPLHYIQLHMIVGSYIIIFKGHYA